MSSDFRIRNSAKAIVYDEASKSILFIEHRTQHREIYFTFPGGGQEHGESLTEALQRECLEEIGCEVVCRDLASVRDYVARNHEFADAHPDFHEVEFYFLCSIDDASAVRMGDKPDRSQTGIKWIALADVESTLIYPRSIRPLLSKIVSGQERPLYLGDVN
jgi:ADP-ribose pyrophosphatase YjhB (NUDIX family)